MQFPKRRESLLLQTELLDCFLYFLQNTYDVSSLITASQSYRMKFPS